jgi:ferredoxin-NADP reductase
MAHELKQKLARTLTNHNSFAAFAEPVMQWLMPQWSAWGYAAKVIENRCENAQVFTLVLRPSASWPHFLPGQHVDIRISIDGRQLQRTFSLSVAPVHQQQTGLIELTIRKQAGGRVTNWLAESLKPGDHLHLSAPRGAFTLPAEPYPMLLIAGGSGITPFRSFIQQLAADAPDRDVHLIYYNEAMTPLFANEWQQLEQQLPGLKISLIDTSQQGMITRQQLLAHCPDAADRTAWLCGPYGLIETGRSLLLDLGVTEQDIHHELFGPRPIEPNTIKQAGSVYFSRSGVRVATTKQSTTPLLTLAEQARLNPISGCRMGVCHQCTCRKQHGLVYNTLTGQTSDTGGEDIQLCVSLPVGDVQLDL